jgi:hypothetical protein
MDLKFDFFINPKMEKQTVYLGKHQLRFKKKLVDEFNLKDGDIIRVGFLKSETQKKHLYLVKGNGDETGFKVTIRNHSYAIAFTGIYDRLKIDRPQNALYQLVVMDGVKVVKIELPTTQ